MNKILITGATGHIGNRVAHLLKQDTSIRLMTRTPEKLSGFGQAEKIQAEYGDKASLTAAFKDIDTAFIVSGYAAPGQRALLHKNAIDSAQQAGVSHIVYLSFQGASAQSKFPMSRDHFQTEEFIRQSGLACTILRDSFYMDLIPEMFGENRLMRGPGGDGKVAWVAREDVARTIAAVLSNPSAYPGTFNLTGREALSLTETAGRLSKLTGKKYTYQQESVEEGMLWRNQLGAPAWEVDTWIGSYVAIAAGEVASVSKAVYEITHQHPFTLEEYVSQHPEIFHP
ncbi:SDR family oxidoreductase [Rhodocytophaga rosea]|uniref:SDR family oxidoreductase n=1 Tax=Rhodocytophaga rosea TaxID=2704465 RepID=A0A6C0GC66_9BACT|nr:SDR family oxidoreductase [Rhodocytophaga rosea]QHT65444.1 SDR family oxidoreductase [Rhodocytophaga rosea]